MSAKPLRLFIADDEPPARARMKELIEDLREECPAEVVGEAGNGQEVLDRLPETNADVLLLDIQMPGARRAGSGAPPGATGGRARNRIRHGA